MKPSESRSKSPTETIASTTSSSHPEPTPSPPLPQPSTTEIGSYDGGLEDDAAAAAREPASEETEELLNVNSSFSEWVPPILRSSLGGQFSSPWQGTANP